MSSQRLPFDIGIVGLGVAGTHQMSREAEETIRRCKQTFVIDSGAGVVHFLRRLCPKVTNLLTASIPGAPRRAIYRKIASIVVGAAMEEPPVCFAASGHPKVYCQPTTLIQRAALVLNLKTSVLAGVSSLDSLFVELDVDPGDQGLQVYDATDLVIRRRPLQTDVPCVIMQAPVVLQSRNAPGVPNLENLRILQNYLLEFYPAHHQAVIVISRTHPLLLSIKVTVPLGRLAHSLRQAAKSATVYIPPVRHREIEDNDLAKRFQVEAGGGAGKSGDVPRRPGRPPIGPPS
jgi:uncharacterized protein YabN with tetrapyrrole methylase and pyrophosphatase domain